MHPIIFTLASLATKDNSTEKLYTASIFVPVVDRLSDGQTNFTFPIRCLVGGLDVKHCTMTVPSSSFFLRAAFSSHYLQSDC